MTPLKEYFCRKLQFPEDDIKVQISQGYLHKQINLQVCDSFKFDLLKFVLLNN